MFIFLKRIILIHLLFPFNLFGQTDPNGVYTPLHLPVDTLRINTSNPKIISYRGEKIFVFENYIDSTKMYEAPEKLNDGKYMGFFQNDTSKPVIEVSYFNGKKNGFQKEYDKYDNKLMSITNYKNGKLNGESFTYYDDGKIYEKTSCKEGKPCIYYRYENDGSIIKSFQKKKTTITKKWNSKGKLIQKEIWKNGQVVQFKTYE